MTELKPDGKDYSSISSSQSAYFIVEPTTAPYVILTHNFYHTFESIIFSLYNTSSSNSSSSLSTNGPSIRITEFNENSPLNSELSNTLDDDDDDIDMQSVASSDTGDKMDDDWSYKKQKILSSSSFSGLVNIIKIVSSVCFRLILNDGFSANNSKSSGH